MEDLTEARVVVVTGASSGIGLAAAEEFVRRGWTVGVVGRNPDRLAAATQRIRAAGPGPVTALRCDFAQLADVRALAAELLDRYPRIDVLANNAGGYYPTRQVTADGFEATIQSNHLAPFLLSWQLRQRLQGGRIVNTASGAHIQGRLDPADLSGSRGSYRSMAAYPSAKQANILFAAEAARRWPEILSTSFHPGVVRTNFGQNSPLYGFFFRFMPGLRTPAKGAETLVWLATVDASQLRSGGYYQDKKQRRPSAKATDATLAAAMWEASRTAVGV